MLLSGELPKVAGTYESSSTESSTVLFLSPAHFLDGFFQILNNIFVILIAVFLLGSELSEDFEGPPSDIILLEHCLWLGLNQELNFCKNRAVSLTKNMQRITA